MRENIIYNLSLSSSQITSLVFESYAVIKLHIDPSVKPQQFVIPSLLHTTPIMDHIGIARIAKHTSEDRILPDLRTNIENGQTRDMDPER